MSKVAIIGAGQVGASAAFEILKRDFTDVVMVDAVQDLPIGKALDMMEAAPLAGFGRKIQGSNDFTAIEESDVVVITAGSPRYPGMSRHDLLDKNGDIIRKVVREAASQAPEAVFLAVTNPLDVMTRLTIEIGQLPRERVLGMGSLLDTARFRHFLAEAAGVSPAEVDGLVVGEHGEEMVLLPRLARINGASASSRLSEAQLNEAVERTRHAGAEIVSYLKSGSAFWAPAVCVAEMVEAIVKDAKTVLPACCLLQGEYGIDDVCLGVPARLGHKGIEEIIELELVDEELEALRAAAGSVKTAWLELKENWGLL